jgi:hypothetical protein
MKGYTLFLAKLGLNTIILYGSKTSVEQNVQLQIKRNGSYRSGTVVVYF